MAVVRSRTCRGRDGKGLRRTFRRLRLHLRALRKAGEPALLASLGAG